MNKQTLSPGQYMKTTSVLRFISKWFPSQILKIKDLKKHEGEYDVYFSTADLKSVMSEDIFTEMEMDCVTHIISTEYFTLKASK